MQLPPWWGMARRPCLTAATRSIVSRDERSNMPVGPESIDARLDIGLSAWNDPSTSVLDGGVSDRLKWMLVLCGIVAFTVVGLTALDSYDEGTCRQTPTVEVTAVPNPVYDATDFDSGPPLFVRRAPEACDGFLPW